MNNRLAFAGVLVFCSFPSYGQEQVRLDQVSLIRAAPAIETEATGTFSVLYDKATRQLSIKGRVDGLSSPLVVPVPAAQTEIHLHHPPTKEGAPPPIIEPLTVEKEPGGLAANFVGEFTLAEDKAKMFLAGKTFVLIHTENNRKGEVAGNIDPITLIRRKPHLDTDATGAFSVAFDHPTRRIKINGHVEKLSSPLVVPKPAAQTEIHLHHFWMMDQTGPPPIIEPLVVEKKNGGLAADFHGDFTLNEDQTKMFSSGMTFVLVHTQNNRAGEVVGYIDSGADAKAVSFKQFNFDHPLVEQYRRINKHPVLPLSRNELSGMETDDSPFPGWVTLKDNRQFLDKRSGSGSHRQTENERYLRQPVAQVEPNGSILNADGTDTHKNSFYDHPNVQPRPFRTLHLRYVGSLEELDIVPEHPGTKLAKAYDETRDDDEIKDPSGYKPEQLYRHLPHLELAKIGGPITYADTPPAMFPEVDPFKTPPGTNLLPTVYENMRDREGHEMVNTLPSHPNRPYNLHEGEPDVTRLDTLSSPTDDLRLILDEMYEAITGEPLRRLWEQLEQQTLEDIFSGVSGDEHEARMRKHRARLLHHAEWGIDILEGNEGKTINPDGTERPSHVPGNRAYRGFALLHHSGHERTNRVLPVYDSEGKIVAGSVYVRQLWYDGRIESDTMFYDYGWDDLPIRVKVGEPHDDDERNEAARQIVEYEVRWYSPTDPALTREHWNWSRSGTPVSEDDVKELRHMPAPIPHNVPLYATCEVSVLNRGEDDFSTTIVHFDAFEKIDLKAPPGDAELPWGKLNVDGKNIPMRFGPPHIAMDASFFPLQEGTRTTIKLKLADAQYHNVHYTWGWRKHPPRAQAVENMHKRIPPSPDELKKAYHILWDHPTAENFFDKAIHRGKNVTPRLFRLRIDDHERFVFGGVKNIQMVVERYLEEEMVRLPAAPGESDDQHAARIRNKLVKDFERLAEIKWLQEPVQGNPINKIGDLAPAKQMWQAFHSIRDTLSDEGLKIGECLYEVIEARNAYLDWKDRNHLPTGLRLDEDSDLTMLYVNNTLYGELTSGSPTRLAKWRKRGQDVKITLINGDYFIHGYVNPDFGGLRGYENQFKPTLALGGQGSLFTFGRFNWRFNVVGGAVPVPPGHVEEFLQDPQDGEPKWQQIQPRNITDFSQTVAGGGEQKRYRVVPGVHRVWIRYNFEPSRRLRFYQFDPLHHDVAIYSIH